MYNYKNISMKTLILTNLFLLISGLAFSQTCHEIQFTYDASGNRIQREYVVVSCNDNNHSQHKPPKSDSGSKFTNIYPNPTSNLINIDITLNDTACSEPTLIYLFDANAQPVFLKSISSHNIKLDISSLAQGTYIIKAICCNYQSSTVILKTKSISGVQTTKSTIELAK